MLHIMRGKARAALGEGRAMATPGLSSVFSHVVGDVIWIKQQNMLHEGVGLGMAS